MGFLTNQASSDINMDLRIEQLEGEMDALLNGLVVIVGGGNNSAIAEASMITVNTYAEMINHEVKKALFKVLNDEMNPNPETNIPTQQFYVKDDNEIYWIPTQIIV